MKLDITKIDRNFLNGTQFSSSDMVWMDVLGKPFSIHGLAVHEGERFERLPYDIAAGTSEGVKLLSTHTAGGRVRFRTDAREIALRCESLYSGSMTHMTVCGSAGLDVYADNVFAGSVRPANDEGGMFEGMVYMQEGVKDVTVNLPLYNGIKRLYIGFRQGTNVLEPEPYSAKPIVFYGSSITQGGCASRPGNSYEGFISRWMNADFINLGFSGNGKGEEIMAHYIASLDMSAFVLDYDYNAPDCDHLEKTHERFFTIIRQQHPELPVLILSKPDCDKAPEDAQARKAIILRTYQNAVSAGDRHVAFLDGSKLFGDKDRDACTVDGCHPNDLGFYRMAQAIYTGLKGLGM